LEVWGREGIGDRNLSVQVPGRLAAPLA